MERDPDIARSAFDTVAAAKMAGSIAERNDVVAGSMEAGFCVVRARPNRSGHAEWPADPIVLVVAACDKVHAGVKVIGGAFARTFGGVETGARAWRLSAPSAAGRPLARREVLGYA